MNPILGWLLQVVLMMVVGFGGGAAGGLAAVSIVTGFPPKKAGNVMVACGFIGGFFIGPALAIVHIITGWTYGNIDAAVLIVPSFVQGIVISQKFK